MMLIQSLGMSTKSFMETLQPFGNRYPKDEAEFIQLAAHLRRVGHIWENAPNNIQHALNHHHQAHANAYFNEGNQEANRKAFQQSDYCNEYWGVGRGFPQETPSYVPNDEQSLRRALAQLETHAASNNMEAYWQTAYPAGAPKLRQNMQQVWYAEPTESVDQIDSETPSDSSTSDTSEDSYSQPLPNPFGNEVALQKPFGNGMSLLKPFQQ